VNDYDVIVAGRGAASEHGISAQPCRGLDLS
jgi:hypothetical protein